MRVCLVGKAYTSINDVLDYSNLFKYSVYQ